MSPQDTFKSLRPPAMPQQYGRRMSMLRHLIPAGEVSGFAASRVINQTLISFRRVDADLQLWQNSMATGCTSLSDPGFLALILI